MISWNLLDHVQLRLTLIFGHCRVCGRAVWCFRVVCCKRLAHCGHCPLQIRRWTKDVKGPFAAALVLGGDLRLLLLRVDIMFALLLYCALARTKCSRGSNTLQLRIQHVVQSVVDDPTHCSYKAQLRIQHIVCSKCS